MEHAVLETTSERYVLEEYLAEGGMGAIYLGKRLGIGGFEKQVVLKQLLPEHTSEPQFVDLFLREARTTAALDHANIVHTIDLVSAGRDYFIVMEYVRGGDLRTLVRRAKRRGRELSPEAALYVGQEIADALGYAHAKRRPDGQPLGLVHRDVSPSNILLSGAGEVKLTDFGIAKASTHRSVFYKVKGKVGYMSPEQARGEPLDERSDLYSLAVCVYEVLAGEKLFVGDMLSTPSIIYTQPVPRVSERRPGLARELDAVISKALAVRREERFQSAAEMQEALRRIAIRTGLAYSSADMAAHLADVCGSDVDAWLRSDVGDERSGSTELYEQGEEEEESGAQHRVKEGTQLTSLLNLERRARGMPEEEEEEAAREEPPPTEARPRKRRRKSDGTPERRKSDGTPEHRKSDGTPEHDDEPTRTYTPPPRSPPATTTPPRIAEPADRTITPTEYVNPFGGLRRSIVALQIWLEERALPLRERLPRGGLTVVVVVLLILLGVFLGVLFSDPGPEP